MGRKAKEIVKANIQVISDLQKAYADEWQARPC